MEKIIKAGFYQQRTGGKRQALPLCHRIHILIELPYFPANAQHDIVLLLSPPLFYFSSIKCLVSLDDSGTGYFF